MTHLLHLDDDELLFVPHGIGPLHATLRRLPREIGNVHALTLEALVPSLDCQNPFAEARVFRHQPVRYSSYGPAAHNAGKSMGVLRCKRLRCTGPHHFSNTSSQLVGKDARDATTADELARFDWTGTHVLKPSVAVILHYESCTFARWQLKYTECAQHLRSGGDRRQGFLFDFCASCRRAPHSVPLWARAAPSRRNHE